MVVHTFIWLPIRLRFVQGDVGKGKAHLRTSRSVTQPTERSLNQLRHSSTVLATTYACVCLAIRLKRVALKLGLALRFLQVISLRGSSFIQELY